MTAGFAIDYAYASYINQRLARSADDATLAAVSQTAATAVGGYSNLAGLQTYGTAYFNDNIRDLGIADPGFNLSVTSDGNGGVVAAASYHYFAPTFFSSIAGISAIPTAGTARAAAKPVVYATYYILVDTSQSMGIASTTADMATLYSRTSAAGAGGYDGDTGCVFGCHVTSGHSNTNEQLAHNYDPPVTLRIDSAKTAIKDIIQTASTTTGSTGNIAIGLYMIQANPFDGSMLVRVHSPTTDFPTLLSSVDTIDLGPNDGSVGYGDTDFVHELAALNNLLPANGTGASAVSPLNYVFIITDGVQDTTASSCSWTHCTGPLDSSKCTPLKTKATVGVIYTTYLQIMQHANPSLYDSAYQALVLPFAGQIAPALQNCATSSDYYFEAAYDSQIISAVQALFLKTLPSTARLTQ